MRPGFRLKAGLQQTSATVSGCPRGERKRHERVVRARPTFHHPREACLRVSTPGGCREGGQLLGGQVLERSSLLLQPRLEPQGDLVELR